MQPNEQQKMIIGGNLNDALKGHYTLSIIDSIKQSVRSTQKHWSALLLGFAVFIGILFLLSIVIVSILPEQWTQLIAESPEQVPTMHLLLLSLLGAAIGAPFWGSFLLMGIRHSVDIPSKVSDTFEGFKRLMPLILTLMITNLVTQLAASLLGNISVVLGFAAQIYLFAAFSLALPLVMERRLTPLNAIYYSLRIVNFKLPQFIILVLFVMFILVTSIMLLFIPLLFVIPLIFNLCGIVYKDVVGVSIKLDEDSPKQDQKPHWDA